MESYRATYTEADMDGILAFFKSPVGQIYLHEVADDLGQNTRSGPEAKVKELGNMFQTMVMDGPATPNRLKLPAAPAAK